mgnify:CR=1 FL=1
MTVDNGVSPCYPTAHGLAYQCVEYIRRYYALALGHTSGMAGGNAKDYLGVGDRGGLETHKKEGDVFPTRPRKGDLLVQTSGGVGHVAIVKEVSGGSMTIAQQNVGVSLAEENYGLSSNGAGGWRLSGVFNWAGLRRKSGAAPASEAETSGGGPAGSQVDSNFEIFPGVPVTPSMSGQTYRVQPGDSLSAIAARFDIEGGHMELARINGIADPSAISVGQVLRLSGSEPAATHAAIPAGLYTPPVSSTQTYRVRSGDSLSAIAARFNVRGGYLALARFNNINNPDALELGQVLNIPG